MVVVVIVRERAGERASRHYIDIQPQTPTLTNPQTPTHIPARFKIRISATDASRAAAAIPSAAPASRVTAWAICAMPWSTAAPREAPVVEEAVAVGSCGVGGGGCWWVALHDART